MAEAPNGSHVLSQALWPDFNSIANGDLTEQISAIVIGLIIFVFLGAVYALLNGVIRGRLRIAGVKRLLKDVTEENVAARRRDLVKAAAEKSTWGEIWSEFDESLVESHDGQRLFNTLDAAHFFNERTVAHEILQNRLLAAVPAFLTAIGVIGTFLGLAVGMEGFAGKFAGTGAGEAADKIKAIEDGIGQLISGASVAFKTSVWGIGASLLFNFVEKFFEREARYNLRRLQHRIDTLFRRLTSEEQLREIADHERHSREILQGLAEQIGNRMQVAVEGISERMKESLEDALRNVLSPATSRLIEAAEKLNERQAQGSEETLKSLVGSFMDQISASGQAQKQSMEAASQGFQESFSAFSGQLTSLTEQMQRQSDEAATARASEGKALSSRISALAEAQEAQSAKSMETVQRMGNEFSAMLASAQAAQRAEDERRAVELEKTAETITQAVSRQADVTSTLTGRLESLSERLQSAGQAIIAAGQGLMAPLAELNRVAQRFESASVSISSSADVLRSSSERSAATIDEASRRVSQITESIANLVERTSETSRLFSETASDLRAASTEAREGFERLRSHFSEFADQLREHIRNINDEVSKLLDDYSQRVQGQTNERLNVWNEQTSQYAQTMNNAISALAGVVDDIENKVKR